jgi:hypothetical protein
MTKVRIQSLGPGSTKKNGPKEQESVGVRRQQFYGVVGIDGQKDFRDPDQLDQAQDTNHREPEEHEGSKGFAEERRAKLLNEKQNAQDYKDHRHHGNPWLQDPEAFNGRGDGNGRSDDPVCQQGTASHYGHNIKPVFSLLEQGEQGHYAPLPFVIGL